MFAVFCRAIADSNDSEVSSDASEENQLDSTQPLEETTETDSVLTVGTNFHITA